jgi:hypothetical protein
MCSVASSDDVWAFSALQFIDLFNPYLFVESHIVNTDGSNLDPVTDVGSVDLWMHSLFSDVSVSLSEKLVSPPTNMYPYRAYIERFHKQVRVEQVDAIVSSSTDCKFIRTLVR